MDHGRGDRGKLWIPPTVLAWFQLALARDNGRVWIWTPGPITQWIRRESIVYTDTVTLMARDWG